MFIPQPESHELFHLDQPERLQKLESLLLAKEVSFRKLAKAIERESHPWHRNS